MEACVFPDLLHQIDVEHAPWQATRLKLDSCCSDKIAKWQLLGWQGALLSSLLKDPIRFASITSGSKSEISSFPMRTPSGPNAVAMRPVAQDMAPERAPDLIPYVADSVAPEVHCGVSQGNIDIVNDKPLGDHSPSTRWAAIMQAQQAAMFRAFYGRCRDSWVAIMGKQQQGHTSPAEGMRWADTHKEANAARALLRGWKDFPPEVRWFLFCVGNLLVIDIAWHD